MPAGVAVGLAVFAGAVGKARFLEPLVDQLCEFNGVLEVEFFDEEGVGAQAVGPVYV